MNENSDVVIDLFVRSLTPASGSDRGAEVIETLDRLEAEGHIDDYNVRVWGDAVAPNSAVADTEAGTAIQNRVAAFKQWALAENVSVAPFFGERDTDSKITGERQTVTTLPEIALAEYEGKQLVSVSPHADDETVTVRDHLAEIEARRSTTLEEEANAATRLAVPGGD